MKKISYFVFLLFTFCASQENKINGISFVASDKLTSQKEVNPVKDTHANWVTLMPFAFMKTINDTTIFYNSQRQWIGEREEGIKNASTIFHFNQIYIFLFNIHFLQNNLQFFQILFHLIYMKLRPYNFYRLL